jgi:hypothetical protein
MGLAIAAQLPVTQRIAIGRSFSWAYLPDSWQAPRMAIGRDFSLCKGRSGRSPL